MPERGAARGGRGFTIRIGSERVRPPLPVSRVRQIVTRVLRGEAKAARRAGSSGEVTVTFLGPSRMRRLNREWKGHDRPTDVLSFRLPQPGGGAALDVYICPAVARAQARDYGISSREELTRLVVHGLLHTLGYDHPEGEGRTRSPMWRRQEHYVKALV